MEIKNGKGNIKEYNSCDESINDGEFLNGEWNRKGKKYGNDKKSIVFEGEILNGKPWNGKGYDEFGEYGFVLRDCKEFRI